MKITCPLKKFKKPTTRLFESRAETNFKGVCRGGRMGVITSLTYQKVSV